MGSKYSICTKNLTDKWWIICDYHINNAFMFFIKGIYYSHKYDIIEMRKHAD